MLSINNPIITNKRIKGRRTSNQEIPMCPSLQIKLRTYVQKTIYMNLTTNTKNVLGTLQEKFPTL